MKNIEFYPVQAKHTYEVVRVREIKRLQALEKKMKEMKTKVQIALIIGSVFFLGALIGFLI